MTTMLAVTIDQLEQLARLAHHAGLEEGRGDAPPGRSTGYVEGLLDVYRARVDADGAPSEGSDRLAPREVEARLADGTLHRDADGSITTTPPDQASPLVEHFRDLTADARAEQQATPPTPVSIEVDPAEVVGGRVSNSAEHVQ